MKSTLYCNLLIFIMRLNLSACNMLEGVSQKKIPLMLL